MLIFADERTELDHAADESDHGERVGITEAAHAQAILEAAETEDID